MYQSQETTDDLARLRELAEAAKNVGDVDRADALFIMADLLEDANAAGASEVLHNHEERLSKLEQGAARQDASVAASGQTLAADPGGALQARREIDAPVTEQPRDSGFPPLT